MKKNDINKFDCYSLEPFENIQMEDGINFLLARFDASGLLDCLRDLPEEIFKESDPDNNDPDEIGVILQSNIYISKSGNLALNIHGIKARSGGLAFLNESISDILNADMLLLDTVIEAHPLQSNLLEAPQDFDEEFEPEEIDDEEWLKNILANI